MKKVFFVLVAMLTVVFTGCKIENTKLTIAVEDTTGLPVANREVFYTDLASAIISTILPSPESLVTDIDDCWDYAVTNAQGTVTMQIPMGVSKLKYRFMTFDYGSNTWVEQDVELHRGATEEVKFVVNR